MTNTDMFNRISRRYDLLNHLLSLGIDCRWRRKLVRGVAAEQHELAAEQPEQALVRVLDVATGTGDVAIAIARKLPQAEIIGVDLSEGMLEIGRAKIARRGLNISLSIDNGEALSFANNSFDAITIAFGIRNFSYREAGLREFARVLRPGGSVHILEFSTPRKGFFVWGYRLYFHHILPFIGRLISGDKGAYSYLPASVDNFPAPEKFVEMMQTAGFSECAATKLSDGIAYIYAGTKK